MPEFSRPDWSGRLQAVRDHCVRHALDAFVVSGAINIRYLTGFTGSAGLLVVSSSGDRLITDGRYDTAVRLSLAEGTLAPVTVTPVERRYDRTLLAVLSESDGLGAQRVGYEATHVTVSTLRIWQHGCPTLEWLPFERVVERRRAIKDDGEVEVLRRGARALSGVAASLAAMVRHGLTEQDVARAIDESLDRAGFSHPAFPTIVASGPQSALPHARPTTRRLERGDLVLLDFGGVLDGYCVDLTRMASIGPPDRRAASLFEAVRDAQAAALAAIRPGAAGADVDRAARQVLIDHGLGPAFVHSTGHGLGLEVHEAPRLGQADPDATDPVEPVDLLEAGMVCTVEPGAYLAGVGGVRLEDDVLITADGCDVLTTAPRDLIVIAV